MFSIKMLNFLLNKVKLLKWKIESYVGQFIKQNLKGLNSEFI